MENWFKGCALGIDASIVKQVKAEHLNYEMKINIFFGT